MIKTYEKYYNVCDTHDKIDAKHYDKVYDKTHDNNM